MKRAAFQLIQNLKRMRLMKEQPIMLGLRPNIKQFLLLAINNAFVGAMVGVERTVVPLIGEQSFHLSSLSVLLAFIVSFGLVKGPLNLVAGRIADRWGRKPVLLAGWLFGIPVPIMIIFAPNWTWIIAANLLLGANQGFAWSMTVTSKIDIVGPGRRGLALGINEFSGYVGVSLISSITGYLAFLYGPRPIPFVLAEILALIGFLMAWLLIKETLPYTQLETSSNTKFPITSKLSMIQIVAQVSFQNQTLFACSQAGLVNKLSDTVAWGLVPIVMVNNHFTVIQIGLISGIYAVTWGVLQLGSGVWSDHIGRKFPIVLGQIINAIGIGLILISHSLVMWIISALWMGAGTALVYPVLFRSGRRSTPGMAWLGPRSI